MSKSGAYEALVLCGAVKRHMTAFQHATRLRVTIASPRSPVSCAVPPFDHPVCTLVKSSPLGHQCGATLVRVQRRLERRPGVCSSQCFAGLTIAAVPVVVGREHIATIWAGPALVGKVASEGLRRVAELLAREGRADREESGTCPQAPLLTEQEFRAAMRLLREFANQLAELASRYLTTKHSREHLAVRTAKEFLENHFSEHVTLQQVATHSRLSRSYFCVLFKKTTGMTFGHYVNSLRVEKAKAALRKSQRTVADIAFSCGYQSLPHFNRVFKSYVGVTPGQYRLQP